MKPWMSAHHKHAPYDGKDAKLLSLLEKDGLSMCRSLGKGDEL